MTKCNSRFLSVVVFLFLLFSSNAPSQTFVATGGTTVYAYHESIWTADFDGDKFTDFLALYSQNSWSPRIYKNYGGVNGQWLSPYPSPSFATNYPDFRGLWRDANGDGRLDLLATVRNDLGDTVARFYSQTPEHTFQPTGVELLGTPVCWADLDNDGRLDVINTAIQYIPARIYWAQPDGGFIADPMIVFPNVQAVDLDRDGDLDLVMENFGARVFRNDGHRKFTDVGSITPNLGKLVDLDGDGWLDMFANQIIGPYPYIGISWAYFGRGNFQMSTNRIITQNNIAALCAADFNGDGFPDLLTAGNLETTPTGRFLIRTNSAYIDPQYTFSGNGLFYGANVGDFNGDGSVDILAQDNKGFNAIYLNRLPAQPLPPPPTNASLRVTRDRVYFNWSPGSSRPVTFNLRIGSQPGMGDIMDSCSLPDGHRLLPQMGNTQTSTRWKIEGLTPGTYYWTVQAVDWAYRGSEFLPELSFNVTGFEDPEPVPTISIGSTNLITLEDTPLETPILFGPVSIANALSISLTGGDPSLARVEVLGSGPNRTLSVLPATNRFGSTSITIHAILESGETTRFPLTISVLPVNDAPIIVPIPDTIAYVADPTLVVPIAVQDVETDSSPQAPPLTFSASSSDQQILPSSAITVIRSSVSFNLSNAKPGSTTVTIVAADGEHIGSRSFTLQILPRPFRWMQGPGTDLAEPWAADFNNDGWMDIANAMGVFLNDSVGWRSAFVMGYDLNARIAVADFNRDNFIDVLNISPASARLYLNRGGTNFIASTFDELRPCNVRQIETADLDNDGDADLIVNGTDPAGILKTWVYLNTSAGFAEKQTELPAFNGVFALADLDRDSRTDFVFSGFRQDLAPTRGVFLGLGDGTFLFSSNATASLPPAFRGIVDIDNDSYIEAWSALGNLNLLSVHSYFGQFIHRSSVALNGPVLGEGGWVDLENDGSLDFLGRYDSTHGYVYLRNRGAYQFLSQGNPFRALPATGTTLSFADIDNNGAIDVVTSAGVWINLGLSPNFPPMMPTNLRATHTTNSLTLEWYPSFDLNQNGGLTYNVRVGTRPGANDILSAASLPSGKRLLPRSGNAGASATITITNLTAENYFWSVQAVDDIYAASSFAPEQIVFIDRPGNLPPTIDIALTNIAVLEDTSGTFVTAIRDDRTIPDLLSVAAESLDPFLISNHDISLTATGGVWTVGFIPLTNKIGTARILLRATDAAGAVSIATVEISIVPVNDPPSIAPIPAQIIRSPLDPISVPLTLSDIDDLPGVLRLTAHSGNQALLRDDDIHFGGAGSSRTVELGSQTALVGTVPVTVTATDPSGAFSSATFTLTVTNNYFQLDPTNFGPEGPAGVSWGDLNNDGWLDVAVGLYNTLIYTNGPGGLGRLPGIWPAAKSLDWGDFNRDGYLDLLSEGAVYTNDHAAGFNLTPLNIIRRSGPSLFTDIDNDGDVDLVLTGDPWTLAALVYRNNFGAVTGQSLGAFEGIFPIVEDFDGDGNLDLRLSKRLDDQNGLWADKIFVQTNGLFIQRKFPWESEKLLAWSDFTNDGRPDALVLTTNAAIQLYRRVNDGFSVSQGTILPFVQYAHLSGWGWAVATGDFDSDGWMDLVLFTRNRVYFLQNLRNGDFAPEPLEIYTSSLPKAWSADYNNDGRLDLMYTWQSPDRVTQLLRNTILATNSLPSAPFNLRANNTADGILIQWDEAFDPNQSGGLTYNVAAGSSPGQWDLVSPMSAANGWRKIPQKGNASWNRSKLIKGLPAGKTVYFTVQSVDNSFAGSPFAPEQTIVVTSPPRLNLTLGPNQSFDVTLIGEPGADYTIETSTDLTRWDPLWSWTASARETRFTLPINGTHLFIRARGL